MKATFSKLNPKKLYSPASPVVRGWSCGLVCKSLTLALEFNLEENNKIDPTLSFNVAYTDLGPGRQEGLTVCPRVLGWKVARTPFPQSRSVVSLWALAHKLRFTSDSLNSLLSVLLKPARLNSVVCL